MQQITIKGTPIAQQRHRYRRVKNKIISYDPNSRDKQAFAMQLAQSKPKTPYNVAIFISILFCFPRPKSHFRTGRFSHELKPSAPEFHGKKPDLDNLAKFVMDAGNKILWKDDSIIDGIRTMKRYSEDPRTEIEIWASDEEKDKL